MAIDESTRLNIITWNANSVHLKRGTRFSQSHPNYVYYRLDRVGRPKSGVAVMARHNLAHTLLSSFRTRVKECIGVSVTSLLVQLNLLLPTFLKVGTHLRTFLTIGMTFFTSRLLEIAFSFVAISIPDTHLGAAPEHVCISPLIFHLHLLVFLEYPIKDRLLDVVLTNSFHEVCDLSTRTALSSDHLPVLVGVELNVRREVTEHFVFDYKNADWT
jgi:hypothetical protein